MQACVGVALVAGGYFLYTVDFGSSNTSTGYERNEIFDRCDRDYIQSAPYLPYSASTGDCECFDDKLQHLSPSQRSAAYKSLEHRLTLAFMGKAGAKVEGSRVKFKDEYLGDVDFKANVETSGNAIMDQCSMF